MQPATEATDKPRESLRRRFLGNTALVIAGVMLVSFVVIDLVYRSELEKAVYARLQLHIFALLSVAEIDNGRIRLPDIAHDPKLNTGNSGLWAVVLDEEKTPLWTSLSLNSAPVGLSLSPAAGQWQYDKYTLNGEDFFTAAYRINWQSEEDERSYHLLVSENQNVLQGDIHEFRQWLFGAFSVMTIILLGSQYTVLLRAFQPIRSLENEIHRLEQGQQNRLSGHYPKELSGVANNLNALIKKEHSQRERYRASMADLAHSLKTPMAVINTEIASRQDTGVLQDAVKRIDSTIEYQLRRAVLSNHTLLEQHTDVQSVLQQVVAALQKIYRDKNITVSNNVGEGLFFPADENDLMEIFGNLLDNAFKYARKQVRVVVIKKPQQWQITVEDDGDGFNDEEERQTIFRRGQRLDNRGSDKIAGQGIGLAVVEDIVNSYEGTIEADNSGLGGALFNLRFPIVSIHT